MASTPTIPGERLTDRWIDGWIDDTNVASTPTIPGERRRRRRHLPERAAQRLHLAGPRRRGGTTSLASRTRHTAQLITTLYGPLYTWPSRHPYRHVCLCSLSTPPFPSHVLHLLMVKCSRPWMPGRAGCVSSSARLTALGGRRFRSMTGARGSSRREGRWRMKGTRRHQAVHHLWRTEGQPEI